MPYEEDFLNPVDREGETNTPEESTEEKGDETDEEETE